MTAGTGHRQLGQILLDAGILDELQLRSALGHQRQWGGRLGRILVEMKFIDEAALASTLAKQMGLRSIRITGEGLSRDIVRSVPQAVAERYWVFPIEAKDGPRGGGELTLAVADPTNLAAVEDLRFHTGKRIQVVVAPESDIEAAIKRFYYGDDSITLAPAPDALFERSPSFLGPSEDELAELEPLADPVTGAPAPAPSLASDPLGELFGDLPAPPLGNGADDLFGPPLAGEGLGLDIEQALGLPVGSFPGVGSPVAPVESVPASVQSSGSDVGILAEPERARPSFDATSPLPEAELELIPVDAGAELIP
ncbi:MAG: GspE/PulE/PilB domain-containing protein, partial [Deltaproteobacteria bacterium]